MLILLFKMFFEKFLLIILIYKVTLTEGKSILMLISAFMLRKFLLINQITNQIKMKINKKRTMVRDGQK